MKNLSRFLLIFLFSCFQSNLHAWDVTELQTDLSAPITNESSISVTHIAIPVTIGLLFFENNISRPTQNSFQESKPLGRMSRIGDTLGQMLPNALYTLGMGVQGLYGNGVAYERMMGMFKATAYAGMVTSLLKKAAHEQRPGNSIEYNSFPSSHTTNAFSFAGYILGEHGIRWGAPALFLASFVGASRINDNRHYLHDVIAGAGIGLAYGLGMAKSARFASETKLAKANFMIAPIFDEQNRGLAFIYDF